MRELYQRSAYKHLLDWKQRSAGTTAMLIEGARRVGKSTVAVEFGKAEYEHHVLVDFSLATNDFKQRFLDTRGNLDEFFLYLSAATSTTLVPHKTLIIFDEVQLFPPAREFIKHLVADGRFDYLETGSLISLKRNVADILIPSEEESMVLHPMTFREFLWAAGETALESLIERSRADLTPLPDDLHRKAERLFREYMLVGGMPQAVAAYLPERNMEAADRAKRLILKLYRDDIAKYGTDQAHRISAIFDNIPGRLSQADKKLVYAELEDNARSRDYRDAIAWLAEAHLVNACFLCTDPNVGLSMTRDDAVMKCYMADTGLLATMAYADRPQTSNRVYNDILLGNLAINEGMLTENVVAQQLAAQGLPLYFYSKYSREAAERMEIDFLMTGPFPDAAMKSRVEPIEVKSGKRYKTVSLDKFKRKFGRRVGTEFILHPRPLQIDGAKIRLPLYMSGLMAQS